MTNCSWYIWESERRGRFFAATRERKWRERNERKKKRVWSLIKNSLFSTEVPSNLVPSGLWYFRRNIRRELNIFRRNYIYFALSRNVGAFGVALFWRNSIEITIFLKELCSMEYSVEINLISTEDIPSKIIMSDLSTFLVVYAGRWSH